MASSNSTFSLLELDHSSLKESFKTYLQSQDKFKDYDFEGSNINVLLDLLAYNTYKNAFYYNMTIGEAFLDSAQLKSSVVSHAKDLNYLARSRRSSKASITVSFEATGTNSPYTIPKGSPFTALVKNQSFTFTLAENVVVSSSNTSFSFDADIYEGRYVQDSYIVNDSGEFPKFRLNNKTVDTSSLSVAVYEDGSDTPEAFTYTDTLLDLDENSKVYFLQAVNNGYYEVLFGDNFFGRKPKLGSTIVLDYRITSGPNADGASQFSCDFDPTDNDELTSDVTVTVTENAADGLEVQGIESIRAYAPRHFAAQKRAVASDDYASLILANFAGVIEDVNVYGGETIEPKQYGRVILAVKPANGTIAADFVKEEIISYLRKYVSLPTRILLADPEYFYLQIDTTVQYESSETNSTSTEIKGIVASAISDFSDENLELFDKDFRYSKFVRKIDDSDSSITSNETQVKMIKRLVPTPYTYNTFNIKFNNELYSTGVSYDGNPIITSSSFTYIADSGTYYESSYIKDDGEGTLIVYSIINNQAVTINSSLGTVDYTTGEVTITQFNVSEYGTHISLYAVPLKKDIIMSKANVLIIDPADTSITIIGTIS